MNGQDDDVYLEQAIVKEADSQDASPQSPKKNVQMTFVKDRNTGMYKCQMCSYKSMHRSSIKSHYAVHSSLRPYACDQCAYEAKRLNDLRKHKLIKHGKKLMSVRKKYSVDSKKTNGVHGKSSSKASLNNSDDTLTETNDNLDDKNGNMLYQSLCGGTVISASGNGPVFPHPEPAHHCPDMDGNQHDMENSGDIPEDVDKEGTVVVKPEPPDDYYTFQRNLPEQDDDDPIVIPTEDSPHRRNSRSPSEQEQVQNLSLNISNAACSSTVSPRSSRESGVSPPSEMKSPMQSFKDPTEADSTRLHAASPSVISLLLQKRNLTGSSMLTANGNSHSQPKQLRPSPRSASFNNNSSSFYPVESGLQHSAGGGYESRSRYSLPQYNPLNLSHSQHQATRSSSESSHSSLHNTPHSTGSGLRSVAMETNRGWHCEHCNILFFDSAIYFMHMGLHGMDSEWQCNLCGMQLYDVYSFTSHFVNGHVSS